MKYLGTRLDSIGIMAYPSKERIASFTQVLKDLQECRARLWSCLVLLVMLTLLAPVIPLAFLRGTPLGVIDVRRVVKTNASLTGWGAVFEGTSVKGLWPIHFQHLHIEEFELMAVLLALDHFLHFLRNCHVLIRSDNVTSVCCLNRKRDGAFSPL